MQSHFHSKAGERRACHRTTHKRHAAVHTIFHRNFVSRNLTHHLIFGDAKRWIWFDTVVICDSEALNGLCVVFVELDDIKNRFIILKFAKCCNFYIVLLAA